jgi:hypothetical protein
MFEGVRFVDDTASVEDASSSAKDTEQTPECRSMCDTSEALPLWGSPSRASERASQQVEETLSGAFIRMWTDVSSAASPLKFHERLQDSATARCTAHGPTVRRSMRHGVTEPAPDKRYRQDDRYPAPGGKRRQAAQRNMDGVAATVRRLPATLGHE